LLTRGEGSAAWRFSGSVLNLSLGHGCVWRVFILQAHAQQDKIL
jgi:hypothetical protein